MTRTSRVMRIMLSASGIPLSNILMAIRYFHVYCTPKHHCMLYVITLHSKIDAQHIQQISGINPF